MRLAWVRLFVFLLAALLLPLGLFVLYQGAGTLQRLTIVEAERDRWQRSGEVIASLGLHEGNSVVDLGCGSGYFSLKLSRVVGDGGKVIAVDLRRLSLTFLRIRALLQRRWNLTAMHVEANDSHLPPAGVDAVLIANTYHDLTNRDATMAQVFRALRPGGRVAVLDRGTETAMVEADLTGHGFEVVRRVARFIDQPPNEPWWLVVARKP